jgi:hypothetical protein
MGKFQIEVTCIEARASDSGQRAKLIIPLPPPKPVVDGYGNHVAHPPPMNADIRLFVTSADRQAVLMQIDPLQRKKKTLRPGLAADQNHAAEIETERAGIDKQIASLARLLADCPEFRFEHGETYVLTIEKAPKAKVSK